MFNFDDFQMFYFNINAQETFVEKPKKKLSVFQIIDIDICIIQN